MLDRIGQEKARATSIVRYAPQSRFPRHEHPGGEEILVLSGTFLEGEHHYPAGWYMRNPPDSAHQPFSEEGTTIFVKLRQMPPGGGCHVRIDTRDPANWQTPLSGRGICPLYADEQEQVALYRLDAGKPLFGPALARPHAQAELLVLSGEMAVDGRPYPTGTWVRLPAGDRPDIAAGECGVTLYLKMGAPMGIDRALAP